MPKLLKLAGVWKQLGTMITAVHAATAETISGLIEPTPYLVRLVYSRAMAGVLEWSISAAWLPRACLPRVDACRSEGCGCF